MKGTSLQRRLFAAASARSRRLALLGQMLVQEPILGPKAETVHSVISRKLTKKATHRLILVKSHSEDWAQVGGLVKRLDCLAHLLKTLGRIDSKSKHILPALEMVLNKGPRSVSFLTVKYLLQKHMLSTRPVW